MAALRQELDAAINKSLESITDEPPLKKLTRMIDAAGISRVDLKQIVVLGIEIVVATELNNDDIPYMPDETIDPMILERVRQRASVLVDNIFAGRPWLPV